MNNRSIFIAASVFMFSMVISLVDAVIHPPYAAKIPIKILFFFILPMVFFMANKADFYEFRKLFLLKKSGILKALLLGAVLYTVILLGYFLTRGFIDFSNVTPSLTEGMGITAGNFLYVSLYISLVNSFLGGGFLYLLLQFLSGGILFQGLRFHHPEKIHGQEICIHFQFINIRGISRWYAFRNVSYRRIVSASFGANDWRLYFQLSERAE